MLLYTIQPVELYEKLLAEKTLVNTGNFFDDFTRETFVRSYDWMVCQIIARGIEKPENAKYPFWAWYKYSVEKAKPDLRHAGHAPRGTECVCLELVLPDNSVLLSNFDLWHFVLNNRPIFLEENWDQLCDEFDSFPLDKQEMVKQKSWETIFSDFDDSPIQATFWELCIEDIVNVKYFRAR
ncbi:MAG: DUF3841 domain-containing protein [Treponemataceae bacterium]|nr:DUF3841 domain-containing protein [Treponemataceae bacterium]